MLVLHYSHYHTFLSCNNNNYSSPLQDGYFLFAFGEEWTSLLIYSLYNKRFHLEPQWSGYKIIKGKVTKIVLWVKQQATSQIIMQFTSCYKPSQIKCIASLHATKLHWMTLLGFSLLHLKISHFSSHLKTMGKSQPYVWCNWYQTEL